MKQVEKNKEWALGMMSGMAIGDAMGAPIEFTNAREPDDYVTTYLTGGAHNVSLGEFTDDTSMALAMADAFLEAKTFDPHLIMEKFLRWKNEGAYSPRGVMFDCGNTVFSALSRFEADKSNPFTGSTDAMSAGNGGLMRLAPAILAASNLDEAVHFARESTRLTHGADEALFYSALLAEELWTQQASESMAHTKHSLDIARHEVLSGGYVKETYQAAWWAFQTTDSFEQCIIKAINRGHDTDTTGAVAGMIAGAMYGYTAIPKWMLDGLQWHDEITAVAVRLLNLAQSKNENSEKEYGAINSQLLRIQNPVAGKVYKIAGKRCLCINPLASYGVGSTPLWAVEGHSAQLTLHRPRTGYMRGKCISVEEGVLEFELSQDNLGWPDGSTRVRQISVEEIGRYDKHDS